MDILPWMGFGTHLPGFSQPWGSRCPRFFHPAHPHLEQHPDPFTAVGTVPHRPPSSEPDIPVAEYAEPDLVQVSPSSQTGPSTFKPLLDEGYTLPLVVSHYDVPGKYHEYAEPLPPEPEYATPFSEPEPTGTRRSPCGITGLPGSPPVRYDAPTPRPGELPVGELPPWGLGGTYTAPRAERTVSPGGDVPAPEESRFQLGHRPLSPVYHEAL